jgi:hypothetical protein
MAKKITGTTSMSIFYGKQKKSNTIRWEEYHNEQSEYFKTNRRNRCNIGIAGYGIDPL